MLKFYLLLWRTWLVRFVACSVFLAALLAGVVSLFLYVKAGMIKLDTNTIDAMKDIFVFWFGVFFAFSILFALFRSLKFIFGKCFDGYELKLLECNRVDIVEQIRYADLIRVWRKFFMLLIWIVAFEMMLFYVWRNSLNIYALFGFVILGGFFVFVLLLARCKKIKVIKC
jgi:hypothetical protein